MNQLCKDCMMHIACNVERKYQHIERLAFFCFFFFFFFYALYSASTKTFFHVSSHDKEDDFKYVFQNFSEQMFRMGSHFKI